MPYLVSHYVTARKRKRTFC